MIIHSNARVNSFKIVNFDTFILHDTEFMRNKVHWAGPIQRFMCETS